MDFQQTKLGLHWMVNTDKYYPANLNNGMIDIALTVWLLKLEN